jgi:hypothetical protein
MIQMQTGPHVIEGHLTALNFVENELQLHLENLPLAT